MPVSLEIDWLVYFKFMMLCNSRKRHPQLFEARLLRKRKVSAINGAIKGI